MINQKYNHFVFLFFSYSRPTENPLALLTADWNFCYRHCPLMQHYNIDMLSVTVFEVCCKVVTDYALNVCWSIQNFTLCCLFLLSCSFGPLYMRYVTYNALKNFRQFSTLKQTLCGDTAPTLRRFSVRLCSQL